MSVCGTTLDCRSTDVQADVTNCWTAPRHLGDERGRCNVPPPRLAFSRWRLRPSWTVDGPHERRDDPFSPDQQVQRRSPPGGCRRGGDARSGRATVTPFPTHRGCRRRGCLPTARSRRLGGRQRGHSHAGYQLTTVEPAAKGMFTHSPVMSPQLGPRYMNTRFRGVRFRGDRAKCRGRVPCGAAPWG